jgi:hypothetical protein
VFQLTDRTALTFKGARASSVAWLLQHLLSKKQRPPTRLYNMYRNSGTAFPTPPVPRTSLDWNRPLVMTPLYVLPISAGYPQPSYFF